MPKSTPLRLLVVEDDSVAREQLRLLLDEKFPKLEMHMVTTQEQAISSVRRAALEGRNYDLALLDMNLSSHPGEVPEGNQDVYRELRDKMHDAVVIHTTAYPDDPGLMKLILEEAQRPPLDPRSVFLSKLNAEWPSELVKFVSSVDKRRQSKEINAAPAFQSCFISYSHQDEEFVRVLYSRLKSEGLQLWYAAEHMRPGRKLYDEIQGAVRIYDKLLIVLSTASMDSEWVTTEIRSAIDEENRTGRRKLFPVRLVDFEVVKTWRRFDAEVGKDIAVELREYYIPDFSGWRDTATFERNIQALLEALRVEDSS
jgi:CheY-like chemotaxis protein